MADKLYYNTVTVLLRQVLNTLMTEPLFNRFRLVGGTALSLQRGHRMSVDIDIFTDAIYGTVNFDEIDAFLKSNYKYVDSGKYPLVGMGKSYFVGADINNCIKLDIYYTDAFIQEPLVKDKIRMATVEEIIAMKIDVIMRSGRKKDFWDIHEVKNEYSFKEMLALHEMRYPELHNREEILKNFTNFSAADDDFEPDCLRGKYWELVKLDLIEFVNGI